MEIAQNQNPPFDLIPLTSEQHPVTALPKRSTELPFFYLTKKKELLNQPINYQGIDEAGRPIRWKVTPNTIIGAPAIDAHEIWVRLIVPTIELHRATTNRIPEILPLGGVRKCLRMLGWTQGGRQARQLLRGLNRIAAAWCEADFFLPAIDDNGQPKLVPVKGKFSRMSIYAIGEKHLSDEQLKAGTFDFDFDLDATIYLQLHRLEMAIQENQERRYIDNQYMFSIEPTARRWLEIMAPKVFGVVKNNGSHCEIRYSWYVKQHHTLKRLLARGRMTDQMNHVVANHIASGYILKPEYRTIKEPDQEIDFIIRYRPGPMAHASTKRIRSYLSQGSSAEGETTARMMQRPRQHRLLLKPLPELKPESAPAVIIDYQIVAELGKFGITDPDARKYLADLPPDYPVRDVLEYAQSEIQRSSSAIRSPAGFVIALLQQRSVPPPTFETSETKKARQESILREQEAIQEQTQAELANHAAEEEALSRLEAENPERYRALYEQAKNRLIVQYPKMARLLAGREGSKLHEGTIRAGIKQLLRSELHQATNEPISQGVAHPYTPDLPGFDFAVELENILERKLLKAPSETGTPDIQKPVPQRGSGTKF